jgi:hypothetical protein
VKVLLKTVLVLECYVLMGHFGEMHGWLCYPSSAADPSIALALEMVGRERATVNSTVAALNAVRYSLRLHAGISMIDRLARPKDAVASVDSTIFD